MSTVILGRQGMCAEIGCGYVDFAFGIIVDFGHYAQLFQLGFAVESVTALCFDCRDTHAAHYVDEVTRLFNELFGRCLAG